MKVVHKVTGIPRALKQLKKQVISFEDQNQMISEVKILKNLDHPNILKIVDLYEDKNNFYIITELCTGGQLLEKIELLNSFSEYMAAQYIKQVLEAINYCHSHGIIHRDLKPENLLLSTQSKSSKIKVIDFGISKQYTPSEQYNQCIGTPYYIAPEVINKKYNKEIDIWSIGVILYLLLCGYPPFNADTKEELFIKIKSGKFEFYPEDWDRISPEAKDLISKMLTIDPAQRITAEQALHHLWITDKAPEQPIQAKLIQNLTRFQGKSKLQQIILTFMTSQLVKDKEKQELINTFKALDKNNDGTLTKEEILVGCQQQDVNNSFSKQLIDDIFDQMDTNKSGVVDFSEFVLAAFDQKELLTQKRIQQAFVSFDIDNDGYITTKELQEITGMNNELCEKIIAECDINKDGKISQDEFVKLLLNAQKQN